MVYGCQGIIDPARANNFARCDAHPSLRYAPFVQSDNRPIFRYALTAEIRAATRVTRTGHGHCLPDHR